LLLQAVELTTLCVFGERRGLRLVALKPIAFRRKRLLFFLRRWRLKSCRGRGGFRRFQLLRLTLDFCDWRLDGRSARHGNPDRDCSSRRSEWDEPSEPSSRRMLGRVGHRFDVIERRGLNERRQ
jgi:hypothetical protein